MSTKEKILDAALTLFAENGYDGTSVEQIANIVGIKAPSLYKHYKGKEDILNALIDSADVRGKMILPPYGKEFFHVTVSSFLHCSVRTFLHDAVTTFLHRPVRTFLHDMVIIFLYI